MNDTDEKSLAVEMRYMRRAIKCGLPFLKEKFAANERDHTQIKRWFWGLLLVMLGTAASVIFGLAQIMLTLLAQHQTLAH